jgi:hypothetical protein
MVLKRKHYRRDLLDIESILQSSLKPVSPRPEFIRSLQKGLMEYTFAETDANEYDLDRLIIFTVIGLTSFLLVFSLWVRIIVVIISALGMIQSSKRSNVADQ